MGLKLLPGIYEGQFNFCGKRKQDTDIVIRIKGFGKNKTIIGGNLGGFDQLEGGKRRTVRSYTLRISGPSAWLENLTVENTSGSPYPAGRGRDAGQSFALYVAIDRFFCRNVRVVGHQDTLFVAPLPEKVREPEGFRGPDENYARVPSIYIYRYCEWTKRLILSLEGLLHYFISVVSMYVCCCRNPGKGKNSLYCCPLLGKFFSNYRLSG